MHIAWPEGLVLKKSVLKLKLIKKVKKIRGPYTIHGYYQGTHNADSIIESKVIYYLEQCGLGV